MKKILFILLAGLGLAAQAQTVTPEELQGKWKMSYFTDENGSANVETHTVTINDNTPVPKEELDVMYENIINQVDDAIMVIKGNILSNVVLGEEFKSEFKIEVRDGKSYMVVDQTEVNQSNPQVFVKDGLMHLVDDAIKAEFVYKKVK